MKDEKVTQVQINVSGEDAAARALIAQQIVGWLRAGGFQVGQKDPETVQTYIRLPDVARNTVVSVASAKSQPLTADQVLALFKDPKVPNLNDLVELFSKDPILKAQVDAALKTPLDPVLGGTQVFEPPKE